MKAILYKQFSDASELIELPDNTSLEDALEVNSSDVKFFVNGIEVSGRYIPQRDDLIIVRWVPKGLETILLTILIVAAVGGAIYAGVKAYEARKKANELEEQMKNMMKGMNDSVQNLPHLRGASNSIATGKSQPYIIGEHLFTPYKLSSHWYKTEGVDGADQFYIDVYEGGFNPQVLRELRAEEVLLRDFGSGSTPQEGVYQFDADSPFYDEDSFIEVSQDGAAFATSEFNVKIATEESGNELKKADDEQYEDLIYTLPRHTRSVDVCILFNGLRAYNDEGAHVPRTVVIAPSYSLDGGANYTPFTFDQNGTPSNSFTRDTLNQMRFIAHFDLTYAQAAALTEPVLIKLVCSTNKLTTSAYDQVYVESLQSLIYDPDASATAGAFVNEKLLDDVEAALSTRIGIKIKATQSNQDKLTKINVITAGVARTWADSAWSVTKTPTRNLAAWILEVLTSPTHAASRLQDSEVDLDAFGAAYEYYATEGVTVDLPLLDGDEKRSVLAALCEIGGCTLYENIYGETSIALDAPKANAIAVLNAQNLLSLEAEKGFNRKADGLRVSYVSRAGGYQPDSYLVMRDGVTRTSESLIRDVETAGITEHAQIVRYARRLLAIESLRPQMIKAKVGKEGIYYTPLSMVLVQHPALGNGLGSAEIEAVIEEAGFITGLTLREPIMYDSSSPDGFGVIIQAVDETYCAQIAAAYTADTDGRVTEIEFVTPISASASVIPHVGDILSYGYLNLGTFASITSPMLITDIESDEAGYLLSLVDYNEAIYETGTIPAYTPNLTTLGVGPGLPDAPSEVLGEAIIAKALATAAAAAVELAMVSLVSTATSVVRNRVGDNAPASITFAARLPNGDGYPGTFRISEDDGDGYAIVYESASAESSHAHTVGIGLVRVLCEFRVDVDGVPSTVKQIVVDVSLAPDAAPLYWGSRTSQPTTGYMDGDYYFDANVIGSGGGVVRYWDSDSWEELTDSHPLWKMVWGNVAVLTDAAEWASAQGEVVAAATAIFEKLFATNVVAAYLFVNEIEIPSGGSQRWYDGEGVNRRAIEIKNGRMDFIDAPDTAPATPEVLAARLGRLGVNGPAILDGDWRANISNTGLNGPVALCSPSGQRGFGVLSATGERDFLFYIREISSVWKLCVRRWDGSVYGSEAEIGATGLLCRVVAARISDTEVCVFWESTRYTTIKTRMCTDTTWGSESTITTEGTSTHPVVPSGCLYKNGKWTFYYIALTTSESVSSLKACDYSAGSWATPVSKKTGLAMRDCLYHGAILDNEGNLRIAGANGSYSAVETVSADGDTWSDAEEIGTYFDYGGQYIETLKTELFFYGANSSSGYATARCKLNKTTGAWGAKEAINPSIAINPTCIWEGIDGTLHFISGTNEYTNSIYARIGAGIIEKGSNSNGEYIKFGDGTMICKIETLTFPAQAINTGSLITWSYPAEFKPGTNPIVFWLPYDCETGTKIDVGELIRNGIYQYNPLTTSITLRSYAYYHAIDQSVYLRAWAWGECEE